MEDKYWKERYDITCPYCGHPMQCAPSVFHRMGMFECGRGTCSKCEKGFRIIFDYDKEEMKTQKEGE